MEANKDVDSLILVLQTVSKSETSLRRNTVKALGELGDPRSVDPLTELLDDDDRHLRRRVVEALGKIGTPAACASLMQALEDDEIEVQRKSVQMLAEIQDPLCVSALIGKLRTDDRFMRRDVEDALASFGDDAILLLNEVLAVKSANVSVGALNALRKMGPNAEEILIENLEDPDEEVRWGAAYALGKLQSKAGVMALQKALFDPEEIVRTAAVVSLGIIGDEQSKKPLAMLTVDDNDEVRNAAREALKGLGVKEDDALRLAIESNDEFARIKAARELSSMSDERSINALLAACKDPSPEVRATAIESLGRIGSHLIVPAIQEALLDQELIVRQAAQAVVRKYEKKIEDLTKQLKTSNRLRLLSIEKSIENFGFLAIEPLIRMLDDELESVVEKEFAGKRIEDASRMRSLSGTHGQTAERTAKLLQKITGNYFGLNVRAWKQWWEDNKDRFFSESN
jgi:HEAT repeat protein